uniref:O-acyltransferase n=1 Tax=Vombatus ursinus TaxID=29139 RepID=A0A4X2L0X6_VOMUR
MEPTGTQLRRRQGRREKQANNSPINESTKEHGIPDLVQLTRHMEAVKIELLEQAHQQLTKLFDRAIWETAQSCTTQGWGPASACQESPKRTREPNLERQKVFIHRKSLLDELMEIKHFRTIYHIFVAGLCVFIINTLAIDFIDEGRLVLQFDLLAFSFGQLPLALMSWLPMFLCTLLAPYQALWLWARPRGQGTWMQAGLGAGLLAIQMMVLGVLPVHMTLQYQLSPGSRCILVFEQIRLVMKSYSFLREATPGILHTKAGKGAQVPSFSSYLYFLFCPTLIYRESYPRTTHIRWNYVVKKFAQVLACVFYACFILGRLCVPIFDNMSREPFSTRALVLSILHATLPGVFMLLLIFFAFLHCWLNAFSEMLRFADRMFYKDWWNSTSFSNFFRTWNVVVHDWLYSYIYQDGLRLLGLGARGPAMLGVFLISAVVHEYIFSFVLGFFYPVMLILFLFGAMLHFLMRDQTTESSVWNVLMWTMLFLGQAIMVTLYCQEWYARKQCPFHQKTFWGLVTPRSWSCPI